MWSQDIGCNQQKYHRIIIIPFPEPVNIKTRGQIPDGNPNVAISSPTEITAAFAAAKEEYICEPPSERKGVE